MACEGSDGVADGGTPGRSLPPRSGIVIVEEPGVQPTELASALCARAIECAIEDIGALTQEECALYFSLPCFFFSDVRPEDGLAACVTAIRAVGCESGNLMSNVCLDAFARARARQTGIPLQTMAGGTCGDGVECGGGIACDAFGGECGQCVDGAQLGEPCGDGCWDGYCDAATHVCTQEKADGESCASDEECDSFNCSAAGVCKPSVDFTECTLDSDCLSGRCVGGSCSEPVPPGGACSSSIECDDGFCDDGVCRLVARCSLGEAGEPCGPIGCARNLDCLNGICTAPPNVAQPNGASCSTASDCASGFCSFAGATSPVCAQKAAEERCDADEQCASGACVGFRCLGSSSCVE